MRRCPECYQTYSEGERFCEVDGQPLLADPVITAASLPAASTNSVNDRNAQSPWLTGLVGVSVGIVLSLAVYIVHAVWTAGSELQDQDRSSYAARTQPPLQTLPPAPARVPESSQTSAEEEAEDVEDEASPEAAATPTPSENQVATAKLNQGPVSTGPKIKEEKSTRTQTIILMQDGTSVEVDAAWEDKQGVWYRRGGLVSFVESQLVKAITARTEPKVPDETAP